MRRPGLIFLIWETIDWQTRATDVVMSSSSALPISAASRITGWAASPYMSGKPKGLICLEAPVVGFQDDEILAEALKNVRNVFADAAAPGDHDVMVEAVFGQIDGLQLKCLQVPVPERIKRRGEPGYEWGQEHGDDGGGQDQGIEIHGKAVVADADPCQNEGKFTDL